MAEEDHTSRIHDLKRQLAVFREQASALQSADKLSTILEWQKEVIGELKELGYDPSPDPSSVPKQDWVVSQFEFRL